MIVREIGRILVSLLLVVLAGFLYWLGFGSADIALKLGATNVATMILTGVIAYWLKPS